MNLDRETVEHIADLAKLDLSDEEIAAYQAQLSAILEHFDHLRSVNTEEIPPTAAVLPLRSVTRGDDIVPPLTQEEALENAPEAEDGCFKVPAALE